MNETDMWGITSIVFVIGVIAAWLVIRAQREAQENKKKEAENCYAEYSAALEALKRYPNDADLRQEALRLGRAHYGIGLLAEAYVNNDINAIAGITKTC